MSKEVTIFYTYQFESSSYAENLSYGYSSSIHSNYINKITKENFNNNTQMNFYFGNEEDFKFLTPSSGITAGENGHGFTADKINVLIQIIDGVGDDIKPDSNLWKKIDVTTQLSEHVSGTSISSTSLVNTLFKVTQADYNVADYYNLEYIDYPASNTETDRLGFGEEVFFYGNVNTQIKATAFTTDIILNLPLSEFNSTTNPTHDGESPVQISEIGIYDDKGNLVAIGKLNNPISKDSTISRTIVFGMDF